MSNKKDGNNFERRFAKALSKQGSWVHIIQDNHNGQPFDIIEVYGGIAYAYDCKLCKGDVFRCSRIEVNQEMAFKKFAEKGGGFCYIAICFGSEPDTVYCVPYNSVKGDITLKEAKELCGLQYQIT